MGPRAKMEECDAALVGHVNVRTLNVELDRLLEAAKERALASGSGEAVEVTCIVAVKAVVRMLTIR